MNVHLLQITIGNVKKRCFKESSKKIILTEKYTVKILLSSQLVMMSLAEVWSDIIMEGGHDYRLSYLVSDYISPSYEVADIVL